MEWTVRLEVKTGEGEVESLALTTITRPSVMAAAEQVGLSLVEGKALLAGLQAAMVRRQLAEHVDLGRVCPGCPWSAPCAGPPTSPWTTSPSW